MVGSSANFASGSSVVRQLFDLISATHTSLAVRATYLYLTHVTDNQYKHTHTHTHSQRWLTAS